MSNTKMLAIAMMTATALSSTAFALDQPANGSVAERDFTKLSTEGHKAFQDVRLARIAIFDGDTKQAKTYADEAEAAIAKAKTDNTVFMKAEADLKPPASMAKPASGNNTPGATPTAWIPVDGALTLDEDYIATPDKSAGVAAANEKLKKGQSKEAIEALKLAQINAVFVEAVAPMASTMAGIDKAAQLVDAGQYFQANQALKSVEDGVRFDAVDMSDAPKKTATSGQASASTTASPATTAK